MENRNYSLLFLYLFLIIPFSSGADSISKTQSLSGDETLVSSGGNFELGFFRPGNSSYYYIGMWYRGLARQTIVWVANRDQPIADKYSSELKIMNGNLVLLDESQKQTWSTNVSLTTPDSVVAFLLDDGNLVLRYESNSSDLRIWQSFDYPTDTFLPGSKIGYGKLKEMRQFLTSWKNPNDPGIGLFSLELDPDQKQYLIKWNRSEQYWTSGPWNGQRFSLVPEMRLNYIFNYSYVSNENESYFTYSLYNNISIFSRLVLQFSGQVRQLTWLQETKEWNLFWSQPREDCAVYGVCGVFASCNQTLFPTCRCLTGFRPWSEIDWSSGEYSAGCARNTSLQCGKTTGANVDKPSFLASSQLRLPESSQRVPVRTAGECNSVCLDNCSCTAYAYSSDICEVWNNELLNTLYSEDNGTYPTVYIKLALSNSQTAKTNENRQLKIIGIIISVVIFIFLLSCSVAFVSYRRRVTRRGGQQENSLHDEYDGARLVKDSINPGQLRENDKEGIDLPSFDFKIIEAATDYFSNANKLGKGGFGTVFKGKLPGGREVAVKRLSIHSGQGLEEFKSEVDLIAKLQHRNLVKLLGYCTKGEEKILVYEYMPNKSLDTFIFDQTRCELLDWPKRFDVILGIARGLLYLHQDSRLRVIHRDLKTSNILLDEEMNPKISDFGLARIVGSKDTEASTNRVVGTYGYMSPEYAFHGNFSFKSDVFSFGVVMLEIISGKRNTGSHHFSVQALSLLGYAWDLWKEDKALDLMDPRLLESCESTDVLKCIIVGLLCVQEDPGDRPTMMNVVSVLCSESSDISKLQDPKQPAFIARKQLPASSKWEIQTDNGLTVSGIEGR